MVGREGRRQRGLNPAVPRRDAVVLRILDTLASDPVLTAASVSERLGVSPAAAHRAPADLAELGTLGRTKDPRGRLICWTADRRLALVARTEHSNRVGAEDTKDRGPKCAPPTADFTRTSLARIKLPGRVPFGFHGSWSGRDRFEESPAVLSGQSRA